MSPHPGLNDHIYTMIWDCPSHFLQFLLFQGRITQQATLFDDGASNNHKTPKDSSYFTTYCWHFFNFLYCHAASCGRHWLEPYSNESIIFASRTLTSLWDNTSKDDEHWRRYYKIQAVLTSEATCCGTRPQEFQEDQPSTSHIGSLTLIAVLLGQGWRLCNKKKETDSLLGWKVSGSIFRRFSAAKQVLFYLAIYCWRQLLFTAKLLS